MTKTKNAVGPYDTPLWADWLTWLTLLGVVAGIASVAGQGGGAADYLLAIAFQTALFGLIPGAIRKAVRRHENNNV